MSNLSPLVTIYVPCRNYGKYLENALESIENQIYKNWELFIIDEASKDDTINIANFFKKKSKNKVVLIKNRNPIGLQRIANTILSRAKGKYIIRLDADDWFDEMALTVLVSKLESNPKLGIAYGNYYYTDEVGKVLGFERRYKLGDEDNSYNIPPHGACTMIKTKLLKSVGGYSVEINAQDGWDLWFKLKNKTKASSLESPIFYYRQHSKSLSKDNKKLLKARAKIFETLNNSLNNNGHISSCLAVIPIKESYQNFNKISQKGKRSKSLLHLAVESAQKSKNITEVLLSTDSDNVIRFSKSLVEKGDLKEYIHTKRPNHISNHSLNPVEILRNALEEYNKINQNYPDIVLFLSIHSSTRKTQHIDNAINVLNVQSCDSVVSVTEERNPIFKHGKEGLYLLNPGRFKGLHHDRESLFKFNGFIIATRSEHILSGSLFGKKIGFIEIND